MRVYKAIDDWRRERTAQRRDGLTLGFVPTMGALHAGHMSLVTRSRQQNARTLVSIYVNRAQFDEAGDFSRYPRVLDEDLALLERHGADAVMVPSEEEMYPDGYRYRVMETDTSHLLEGAARPGHFDGMLTVVMKLLLMAGAERAYFGEKDWQQLSLVRGMVRAFHLPTLIVGCSTVREADGLAASSRNRLLSLGDRQRAPSFHRALVTASSAEEASRTLAALGFAVDYVTDWDGRRLGAVRLGGVRLIDNIPLPGAP